MDISNQENRSGGERGGWTEWIVEDWSSQQSSSSSSTERGFKKHPWLKEYFSHDEVGGRKLIVCLSCNSQFRNRSHARLVGHFNKCPKIINRQSLEVLNDDMETTNVMKNDLWAMVIVENNIPLRCIESESFKNFSSKVIGKGWKLPTRQELANIYIPKLSRQLNQKFLSDIVEGRISHISIEFDHWEDAKSRSFLGVLATLDSGTRHLLELRDVSLKGHSTNVIVEELIDILELIPRLAINSIISDSASSCKKARATIVKKEHYKHVIQHRCLAHLFNLIGTRMTSKCNWISDILERASKITQIISGSTYWSAYIAQVEMNRVKQVCSVRWYSTVASLAGLLQLQSVILENILPALPESKAEIVEEFNWNDAAVILEVLKPLNQCIGNVERKETSLGNAFHVILEYAKELFRIEYNCSLAITEARKAFLWYLNLDKIGREEFGLYVAAYALSHRYKLDYLTEEGIILAQEAITRIAVRSGISLKKAASGLLEDFDNYRNFQEGFNCKYDNDDDDGARWWKSRPCNGVLSRVAIRLAHLKASSANIERTFSTVKGIQGWNRLNLSTSMMLDLARLKIANKRVDDEQDLDDNFSEYELVSQESQGTADNTVSDANSSSITSQERGCNWIQEQDVETKRNYQQFFQYFNFSIKRDAFIQDIQTTEDVSDDEIRRFIQVLRSKRDSPQPDVIIDSYSQIRDYDDVMLSSNPMT